MYSSKLYSLLAGTLTTLETPGLKQLEYGVAETILQWYRDHRTNGEDYNFCFFLVPDISPAPHNFEKQLRPARRPASPFAWVLADCRQKHAL